MEDGMWVFVPTASPYSRYVVQAPTSGDPTDVRVLPNSVIMAGTLANRPAASADYEGCLYLATDVADGTLYRCNAATWVQVAAAIRPNQLKVAQDFYLEGDISPAQITADQNDYNPTGLATAAVLRLTSDAARNVTGLAVGADGRIIIVHNVGANTIVLKDESASSTAANRFALNADLTLGADQSGLLRYDAVSSRWRLVGTAAAPAKTFRWTHTFAVQGDIKVPSGDTDFLPPFFVSLAAAQTLKLVKARYVINSGTSVTCKLQANGSDITGFTGISVTTTPGETDPTDVNVADNDRLALVVTAVSGTPKNLSFSLVFEATQ
jgi:hypothetical protein